MKTISILATISIILFLFIAGNITAAQASADFYIHDLMKSSSEKQLRMNRKRLVDIHLLVLKSEYEPFLFSVYCKDVCEDVRIAFLPLKADDNIKSEISNKNVEIRRLKMGSASYGVYDWILVPFENEMVQKGDSAYFWITVYVPDNAVPGTYSSIMSVSLNDDETLNIPVELNVLPEKLGVPDGIQFLLLYTVSPFGQHFKPDKYGEIKPGVLNYYKELKAHGMTAISPKNSDWPYRNGVIDGLKAEVRTAVKAGLNGPVLWYMSSLINGAKCGKKYAHYDGNCSGWNESRDIANLRSIVTDVKETEYREDWPEVIFITVDEPGTVAESLNIRNLRMEILEKTMKEVYALGVKGATTVTEPVDNRHNTTPFVKNPNDMRRRWDRVRPYCAVRIYGYGYPEGVTNLFAEKRDAERRGYEMWFYNNKATMGNNRYMARIFYGFWGWKVGARGLASWTYPGARTVQWELVREGIDDLKYLSLIHRLARQRSENDDIRRVAEEFLNKVSEYVKLDRNGYIEDWKSWEEFDFNNFRREAGSIIHQFLQ